MDEFTHEFTNDYEKANAELNAGLEVIAPLIEHHTRVMGAMNGRMQIALDYLTDVETVEGWAQQPETVQQSVRYAKLLVAAVLRIANSTQLGDVQVPMVAKDFHLHTINLN